MKILLTGGNGQLGQALQRVLGDHEVTAVDLPETDIVDQDQIEALMVRLRPNLVINCAAYTDVDGAVADYDTAYRTNALGAQNLAVACLNYNAALLQVSTNEVFAGNRLEGYEEWMPVRPINPYGKSKAAGEFNVRSILPKHYIVRTAWLYSLEGSNFIHAILRRARETGELRVVTDEIGNPTYVNDLAVAIARLIEVGQYGTYHLVNEGGCSRWEFAGEILRQAGLTDVTNEPILLKEFNRPSTPPHYGKLRNVNGHAIGITLRPWQEALSDFLSHQPE